MREACSWSLWTKEIDPNEYDAEEMKKIIEIALLCTQASAQRGQQCLN